MRALAGSIVLALAACQTPCPAPETGPTSAVFRCEDGSDLHVTFTRGPDSALVVQEGYAPVDLPSRITGSGYRYAAEGAELRRRGPEVAWARPGAAETMCRAAP
jgi:hypothetical protein